MIHDRRNLLNTWAKLIVHTLGVPLMRIIDNPKQVEVRSAMNRYSAMDSGSYMLTAGVYLFHAFPGSRATLVGGLKPMSFCNGALMVPLDGQCWFHASLMGALQHVFDNHQSAITAQLGLSVAVIGPGVANDYYARVAGKYTHSPVTAPPLILL
jgi:hypothetical protein